MTAQNPFIWHELVTRTRKEAEHSSASFLAGPVRKPMQGRTVPIPCFRMTVRMLPE